MERGMVVSCVRCAVTLLARDAVKSVGDDIYERRPVIQLFVYLHVARPSRATHAPTTQTNVHLMTANVSTPKTRASLWYLQVQTVVVTPGKHRTKVSSFL